MSRLNYSLTISAIVFVTLLATAACAIPSAVTSPKRFVAIDSLAVRQAVDDALAQTAYTNKYDPAYVKLTYPNGDVPRETGVCADVVIRALRKGNLDLQQSVHEDMLRDFAAYPRLWGLAKPDPNIDHRRVPNLMRFFERQKQSLPVTHDPQDYQPGDVVAWDVGGNHPHIGILSNAVCADSPLRYCVVHNIGAGARLEDVLFSWQIIGHYRPF